MTTEEDLYNLIEETQRSNDELRRKLDDLQKDYDETKRVLSTHTHSGKDGTKPFFNEDIKLKTGSTLTAGYTHLTDIVQSISGDPAGRQVAALVVGDDEDVSNGWQNAEVLLDHQKYTNGSTNQTFFYGVRGTGYASGATGTTGTGSVTSGGTSFSQGEFTFVASALIGGWICVTNPAASTEFDCYEISANTASGITITGGTWTFTGSSCPFSIFYPVYLGSAQAPWRRIYTKRGTVGGIRFGEGDTNGGQNGLLYSDASGDLYWRNYAGASTKLN